MSKSAMRYTFTPDFDVLFGWLLQTCWHEYGQLVMLKECLLHVLYIVLF